MKTKFLAIMMVALMTFSGFAVMLTVDGNDADDVTPDPDAEAAPTYLYGYGDNTYGQLGQGDTTSVPSSSPVQIGADLGPIASVACSYLTTGFITEDGRLFGVGRINRTTVTTPTQIGADLGPIVSVACSDDSIYYITSRGGLYGYGPNSSGQLGQGNTNSYADPVQIGADLGPIKKVYTAAVVSYGSGSNLYGESGPVCFITEDGRLFGVGRINGTTVTTPTQIGSTLGPIKSVICNALNIFFLTESGQLYGYGTVQGGVSIGSSPTRIGASLGSIDDFDTSYASVYFINESGQLYEGFQAPTQIGADLGPIDKVYCTSKNVVYFLVGGALYSYQGSEVSRVNPDLDVASVILPKPAYPGQYEPSPVSCLTTDGQFYTISASPAQLVPGLGLIVNAALSTRTTFVLAAAAKITITPVDADTYGGSISADSLTDIPIGTEISVSGNTVTIGDATITATLADNTAQYTYGIVWSVEDGDTVTSDMVITATFTRTVNTYTVTIESNDTDKGTVSPVTLTDIPYGTSITVSGNTLTIGSETVTATPAEGMEVKWVPSSGTVTGDLTIKANFAEPSSPAQKLMSFIPLIVILAIIMLAATAIASFRGTGFDMVKLMVGLTVCILVLTFALLPAAGGL